MAKEERLNLRRPTGDHKGEGENNGLMALILVNFPRPCPVVLSSLTRALGVAKLRIIVSPRDLLC